MGLHERCCDDCVRLQLHDPSHNPTTQLFGGHQPTQLQCTDSVRLLVCACVTCPGWVLLPGLKWKVSPKEDFYQEVLDLLGGLSTAVKQQQQELIKAVMSPGAAEEEEEHAAEEEGQEEPAAVVA